MTLELAVEDAIEAAAPEVTAIEVESAAPRTAAEPLIPVTRCAPGSTRPRTPAPAARGTPLPELAGLASGEADGVAVGGHRAVRLPGRRGPVRLPRPCARCAGSLAGAPWPAARRRGRRRGAALPAAAAPTTTYAGRARASTTPTCTSTRCPLLVDGGDRLASRCPPRWAHDTPPSRLAAGDAAPDQQQPSAAGAPGSAARCAPQPIADEHQHVVDLESRSLMCTCRPCYLLFTDEQAELRYRAVPDRYLSFPGFVLGQARLGRAADPGRAGVPVPQHGAGPGRRVLPEPGRRHRVRAAAGGVGPHRGGQPRRCALLLPDVEALLVRGDRPRADADFSCHLVPIDACYELVGRMRMTWRGFDGGQEARAAIDEFFAMVERAQPCRRRRRGAMSELDVHGRSTSSPSRTPPRRS